MRNLLILLFVVVASCSFERKEEPKPKGPLNGNWVFLDVRGNYNEAYFTDSTYITYNMVYGLSPVFMYFIKNDSLYSNIDKRKKGLHRIAKIKVITPDSIILTTEFSRDTIGRMGAEKITLSNTDPKKDSVLFRTEIYKRYEAFLLAKGIIKPEEVEAFKKEKKVPEDVIKNQAR
jgi:phage portal protein BeeE